MCRRRRRRRRRRWQLANQNLHKILCIWIILKIPLFLTLQLNRVGATVFVQAATLRLVTQEGGSPEPAHLLKPFWIRRCYRS